MPGNEPAWFGQGVAGKGSVLISRYLASGLPVCRLRLKGLIRWIERTHTYVLTPEGQRVAMFYTKLNNRLLQPLLGADQPQAPPGLRQALATIDHHVEDFILHARLGPLPET